MKVHCPPFAKYHDWGVQKHPKFPCVLLRDTALAFGEPICSRRYECYADGVLFMVVSPYAMILKAGYACDGSTWSPDVADDRLLGDNMLAAFFHDAGYQFSEVLLFREKFPRSFWDGLHYAINREKKFKPRWLYRAGLWAFGWWNFGARRKSKAKLQIIDSPAGFNREPTTATN